MKLSKNKIKQLLKVKNQSQKRVKKGEKAVRGVKKTVGRKRPVNLRNKTLHKMRGGTFEADKTMLEKTLKLDLSVFIQTKDNLTYETIRKLRSDGEAVKKDIDKIMTLNKPNSTKEELKETNGKRITLNKRIETWLLTVSQIKNKKNTKNYSDKELKKRKVLLIKNKTDDLIAELTDAFSRIVGLENIFEMAAAEPVSRADRRLEIENLSAEKELEELGREEEEVPAEEVVAPAEEVVAPAEEVVAPAEEVVAPAEEVVAVPAAEEVAPLTPEEEAELASGLTEAEKNVQLANEELKNTLEHKTAALKYCAETDKDNEAIDEIVQVLKATTEESPIAEGKKLKAVEETVNELSQKPCDPLVDIQNHLLMETSKLEDEKNLDEPLSDVEYKKMVTIKEYVEQSIKNRDNIVKSKKDKEKEIAKLTDMLQELFILNNAHILRLNKEEEIADELNKTEKERKEKILADSRGLGIYEPGETGKEAEVEGAEAEEVTKEGAVTEATDKQKTAEIASLREDIISLLENNPDINIDKGKYGEIEDDVRNWAYTPTAEEFEKFKEFKDYLREKVREAGKEVLGDMASENFESFEQAVNETQAEFNKLPDIYLPDAIDADFGKPAPALPLFPDENKNNFNYEEVSNIIRKRMAQLEEQDKQDKAREAAVNEKVEAIIKNMKDEERVKYQEFVENVRVKWNNALDAQEQERSEERDKLQNLLTQKEDALKTLQQELNEKQTAMEQNAELNESDVETLRRTVDDLRQKLRGKIEALIKATEEWNQTHERAEATRNEQMDNLTTQLQEAITKSNESKDKLEKLLAERNALILKGREDLKKQQELSAKLEERIKELEKNDKNKDELPKWNEIDTALKNNIKNNKDVIDDQEQIKQRLAERITQFENDPKYSEQVERSKKELAELESNKESVSAAVPSASEAVASTSEAVPSEAVPSEAVPSEAVPRTSEAVPSEAVASETVTSETEPIQFNNPYYGLNTEEESTSAQRETTSAQRESASAQRESASAPSETDIQTTTETSSGIDGVQEFIVRIQYPIVPSGKENPGPVLALKGDTGTSTESAMVGIMNKQSSGTQQSIGIQPSIVGQQLPAENLSKGGNKTTRRRKNIYFTKDDFIQF